MRVISGSAKGKKLQCVEGIDIRPTLDRIKESIFNIIAFDIPESSVLDLFSGSGALGIEALSRGASHCVFVDNAKQSTDITKANVVGTHFESCSQILNCDSIRYVNETDIKFDIIFVDPPYESDLYEKALASIKSAEILNPDGILVVECDSEKTPHFDTSGFEILKDKKYGRVRILIMKE